MTLQTLCGMAAVCRIFLIFVSILSVSFEGICETCDSISFQPSSDYSRVWSTVYHRDLFLHIGLTTCFFYSRSGTQSTVNFGVNSECHQHKQIHCTYTKFSGR